MKIEKNKFLRVHFLEIKSKNKKYSMNLDTSLVPFIIIWHSRLIGTITVIGNYKSSSVPIQQAHWIQRAQWIQRTHLT